MTRMARRKENTEVNACDFKNVKIEVRWNASENAESWFLKRRLRPVQPSNTAHYHLAFELH